MSSASSVSGASASARAAKRQRMIPGINPLMAGMNPFMAQMFPGFAQANGFNMFGAGDQDFEDDVPAEAAAAENAAPLPVPGTVPSTSLIPGPAALPAVAEEDVHTRLSPDLAISRNVTYIKQSPRNRLAEACAICCPSLDTGYTAQLSQDGCSCLLWMVTRMVPSVKISNLGTLEQLSCLLDDEWL